MKYSEKMKKIGLNVSYYRKFRSMTQEQLAEKSGISVSFLRKLENPNIFIGVTFEKICKLAEALEVTESELLNFGNTIDK